MDNITLKLYDYLRGKCPFKGCSRNYDGVCLSDDVNHLEYIAKLVDYALNKDQAKIENLNIVCSQVDVKKGHCEFCGEKMIQHMERHPYGSTYTTITFCECPKCN